MVSRSRSFRSEETPGRRWVRSSPRFSSRRTASRVSSGVRWSPSRACCWPFASGAGTARILRTSREAHNRRSRGRRRCRPDESSGRIAILGALIFSKYFYLASLTSYFTFYLIARFHVSVQSAQLYLFVFLAAVAAGTILGGPIGDRIGRKPVIWGSILGVLPFSLLLPHANLFWTAVLVVVIGLILASAFSAIVVYAQELVPGRVGLISGVFFGFAFGMGGLGAAALGQLADRIGIEAVYAVSRSCPPSACSPPFCLILTASAPGRAEPSLSSWCRAPSRLRLRGSRDRERWWRRPAGGRR